MTGVDGHRAPVLPHQTPPDIALGQRTAAIRKEYGARRIVGRRIDRASGDDRQFHATDARNDLADRTSAMVTTVQRIGIRRYHLIP